MSGFHYQSGGLFAPSVEIDYPDLVWTYQLDPDPLHVEGAEPEPVQAWRLTDIIAVVFAAVLALMAVRRIVR
jgi:hypothetical protein